MIDRENAKKALAPVLGELHQLSDALHANPELGRQEYFACAQQVALLKKYGFAVETPYCGGDTAYRAVYDSGKPGPKIAFLAEYDALPVVGHGCGHNLICTISIGAAIVAKQYADTYGGALYVFGAPDEEGSGFKVDMSDAGCFDEMDAAMMAHPSYANMDGANMMALSAQRFTFHGKPAHAAASPEEGLNALDAMINFFCMVNAMRQETTPDARIHGVITKGGVKANIIPDLTEAEFYVRSARYADMRKLLERVINCAKGAALGAGCTMEVAPFEAEYKDISGNQALADLITEELEALGVKDIMRTKGLPPSGSTDAGNVSYCCPTVHAMVGITGGVECALHTHEFAAMAGSQMAFEAACTYMEGLANAAGRLLSEPEELAALKAEFTLLKK